MSRRTVISCLTLAATAAVSLPAVAPASAATRTCSLAGKERKLGPTYVTSLKATGTSCRAARRVVKSYYRCRVENGGKDGTCQHKVRRYSCSEHRSNVIETQYDAHVTCRRGSARVIHDYTQFT
jgi:hypothetical protein